MASNKLLQRIQREAKANPGRAIVLSLLMLVAIYFWAPLAKGLLTKQSTPNSPVAGVAAPDDATATEAKAETSALNWRELDRAMKEDSRMRSAPALELVRNPFADEEVVVEQEAEVAQVAETPPAPEELGLVLTSTVVGPRYRAALISGRVYREGAEIATEESVSYVLAEVGPQQVLLTHGGKTFELTLSKTSAASP